MKTSTAIHYTATAVSETSHPPSVVLTLPFAPTMMAKSQLDSSLRSAMADAERQLLAAHPRQIALPVIRQLQELVRGLNFATHRKSLILQVNSDIAKTLYLDLPLENSVRVDTDFHLRDLTLPGNTPMPYLVLLLSGKRSRMFHYDGHKLQLIKSNAFRPVYAYMHQLHEKVANFTDPSAMKERMLDKFLHHMDEGLSIILASYPLPVFVIGTDKVTGHFARITRNSRHVAVYVHRNCMRSSETELQETLQPYTDNWGKIRGEMALRQIEAALEAGRLTTGLDAIRKTVINRNSRQLILEKRFGESLQASSTGFTIAAQLPDTVDLIIEKVLGLGGHVEWVDDGQLSAYDGIALIRYY